MKPSNAYIFFHVFGSVLRRRTQIMSYDQVRYQTRSYRKKNKLQWQIRVGHHSCKLLASVRVATRKHDTSTPKNGGALGPSMGGADNGVLAPAPLTPTS